MQSVLHLDDRTIAGLVDPVAAERAVDEAFAAWGRGAAATTQRVRASGAGGGMASAMAAVVPPFCGGKLYATHAGRFTFLNALFDIEGDLLATLDGDAVTLLRTAAASSLAIRHLAAPHASVATVIGTGHQAWPHVEMLLRTLPQLAELRICGRTPSAVDVLASRVQADGVSTVTLSDAGVAVDGAQVVVTVTSAGDPLFPAAAVADDALVCAVGATKYDRAEIEPELVGRCSAVVCDDVTGSARGVRRPDPSRRGEPLRVGRCRRAERHRRRQGRRSPTGPRTRTVRDPGRGTPRRRRLCPRLPALHPTTDPGGRPMITSHRLSLEEAELAIDAALAKAVELGVGSVVCVCDAAGWPIAIKRPDNGKPTSVEIAINKAFTAACHRRPTHTYTNAQPGQEAFGIMNMHQGRFSIFVGGWPIEVDGEVIGGIGVSGGHTKEDIACCQAGITAVLEQLGRTPNFTKWDDWTPPT